MMQPLSLVTRDTVPTKWMAASTSSKKTLVNSLTGLGIYSNYRDYPVTTPAGVVLVALNEEAEDENLKDNSVSGGGSGVEIINAFTSYLPAATPYLGASSTSGISHVIGLLGGGGGSSSTEAEHQTSLCFIWGGLGGPATAICSHGSVALLLRPHPSLPVGSARFDSLGDGMG